MNLPIGKQLPAPLLIEDLGKIFPSLCQAISFCSAKACPLTYSVSGSPKHDPKTQLFFKKINPHARNCWYSSNALTNHLINNPHNTKFEISI